MDEKILVNLLRILYDSLNGTALLVSARLSSVHESFSQTENQSSIFEAMRLNKTTISVAGIPSRSLASYLSLILRKNFLFCLSKLFVNHFPLPLTSYRKFNLKVPRSCY
jgi:hypothetical protein